MWVAITRGVADASERIIAGRERRSGRAVFLVGRGSISDVTDTIFRFGISQNIQTRYYSKAEKLSVLFKLTGCKYWQGAIVDLQSSREKLQLGTGSFICERWKQSYLVWPLSTSLMQPHSSSLSRWISWKMFLFFVCRTFRESEIFKSLIYAVPFQAGGPVERKCREISWTDLNGQVGGWQMIALFFWWFVSFRHTCNCEWPNANQ